MLALSSGARAEAQGATPRLVIRPGHEASIEALLAPQDFDTCSLGPLRLTSAALGPGCQVHFHFEDEGGDAGSVLLALTPGDPAQGTANALTCGPEEAGGHGGLAGGLAAAFCERLEGEGALRTLEAACGLPRRDELAAWQLAALGLGLLALLGALTPWILRGTRYALRALAALPALSARALHRSRAAARALAGHLTELSRVPPGPLSLILLYLIAVLTRLTLIALMPRHYLEYNDQSITEILSPPTLNLVTLAWTRLGDQLNLGHGLVWLRLPLAPLALLVTRSLLRLGRTLDAPWTGYAAALLLALLPAPAVMGAIQEHYYWELALSTWFIERLMAWWAGGEACERSLILSAVAAMAVGNMAVLVVAPGLLVFLIVGALRGRRRQTLGWLLLLVTLMAPILSITVEQALTYLQMTVHGTPTEAQAVFTEAVLRHVPFTVEQSAVTKMWVILTCLFDHVGAPVVLGLGLLSLLSARQEPRGLALFGPVVVFGLALTVMDVSFDNSAPLWPSLVFLPLLGAARLHPWARGGPAQILLAATLILAPHVRRDHVTTKQSVIVPYQDMTRVADAVTAGGDGVVLMVGTRWMNGPYLHALCADAEDRAAYEACRGGRHGRVIHTVDGPLTYRERRQVAALREPFTALLPEIDEQGSPAQLEEARRWDRELRIRCRRALAGLRAQVYHCPGYEADREPPLTSP